MVLAAALRAMGRQLAAGHGHERAVGAFDDLQVADHEAVVERDRAERLESLARLLHELDANLGDFHGRSPYDAGVSCSCSRRIPGPSRGLQTSGDTPRVPRMTTKPKVARPAAAHLRRQAILVGQTRVAAAPTQGDNRRRPLPRRCK